VTRATHQEPRPIALGELTEAYVESAQVINVNPPLYSVDFVTQHSMRYYGDVPFMSPYMHHYFGEGVYIMPEVGAMCWVCWPSDGEHPFILGYAPPPGEEGWRATRKDLNPGDIHMSTRDGNGITIRRGGVVQVMAGPLAQRLYLPIHRMIRDVCSQYELRTFGGELTWLVDRPEKNADGDKTTTLLLRAKEKATDPGYVCSLLLGHDPDDEDVALRLGVNVDGAEEATLNAELTVKHNGEVSWAVEDSFLVAAKKNIELVAQENAKVEATQEAMLKGGTSVKIDSGGDVEITATGNITMGGGSVVVEPSGKVTVGGQQGAQKGVLGDTLVSWLQSHTHSVAGTTAAAPTTPASSILAQNTYLR